MIVKSIRFYIPTTKRLMPTTERNATVTILKIKVNNR